MPKHENTLLFWRTVATKLIHMVNKDYTGIPDPAYLTEYGISAVEHRAMVEVVEEEEASNYDGPTQDADRGESPSYRAAMIDAGRGHLLR